MFDRTDVDRHFRQSHPDLPIRWTAVTQAPPPPGDMVDQTLARSSTLSADRLMSGVTLRQTKISDCMQPGAAPAPPLPARPMPESNSDSDEDEDEDSEVGMAWRGFF